MSVIRIVVMAWVGPYGDLYRVEIVCGLMHRVISEKIVFNSRLFVFLL